MAYLTLQVDYNGQILQTIDNLKPVATDKDFSNEFWQ